MLNIAIYGTSNPSYIRTIIGAKMRKVGLGDEVKVTVTESIVKSCGNNATRAPFLRIYVSPLSNGSHESELNTTINALKELKLDLAVETIVLNSFIPKEEMV